jgi:MFS family permease
MERSYGWVIVGAGLVMTCVGIGAMMSLAVFLQPISAATGWSRTAVSAASTLNFLCMGVAAFGWGALSDRYGTRVVTLIGALLLGTGLALASQAGSALEFQLLFGAIVGVAAGSFYAPMISTATGWFTRHRTLAVALVSAGMGVGSVTLSPFARWMISTYDWRTAMLLVGIVAWALLVPAALLVRPAPKQADGLDPGQPATDTPRDYTVAQALRTPQFAAIALTHFACCACHSGPILHMVSYAIGCGLSPAVATGAFGVAGLSGLAGRIGCGLIADRVGAKPVMIVALTIQAVAAGLYLFTSDIATFYGLAVVFGLAYGGVMPLYAVVVREYFGAKIMGSVFGAVAMVSTLGMALGPWIGGYLFDAYASYTWLYIGSLAIGLGAVAFAFAFKPPESAGAMRPAPAG